MPVISDRFLEIARRQGLTVNVWWPDDQEGQHQILSAGVDGILFDDPRLFQWRKLDRMRRSVA